MSVSQSGEVLSQREAEHMLEKEGFSTFTWTDKPLAYYAPHTHNGVSSHYVLKGSLQYTYPDQGSEKYTCGPGDRWDVPAKQRHEVWIGPNGATYVIGEDADC